VKLVVADRFVVRGRGVVVTGTLPADAVPIAVGAALWRARDGKTWHVRGVESDLTRHPFAPGKSFGLLVDGTEADAPTVGDELFVCAGTERPT
jgi:hypothetical protein